MIPNDEQRIDTVNERRDDMREFTVEPASAGDRLDKFVTARLPGVSRSSVQKLIAAGDVLVNGAVAGKNANVKKGDHVTVKSLRFYVNPRRSIEPQDIPLSILYEDDHFLAVNKPAGLVVHPGSGVPDGTLVNALVHKIATLSEGSAADRPGIVHRLDKETSGVLLVAKNNAAHAALASMFMLRKIEKTYVGFCIGIPRSEHGAIELALARSRRDPIRRAPSHDGKAAKTEYWLLAHRSGISAMRFRPHTGRTHQIRVHCSSSGIPILGDTLYGGGKDRLLQITPADRPFANRIFKCFERHALHAQQLRFNHPLTDSAITITAPLPADFLKAEQVFGEGSLFGTV